VQVENLAQKAVNAVGGLFALTEGCGNGNLRWFRNGSKEAAAPTVDRARIARDLKAFTGALPRVDHRIGERGRRKGLK